MMMKEPGTLLPGFSRIDLEPTGVVSASISVLEFDPDSTVAGSGLAGLVAFPLHLFAEATIGNSRDSVLAAPFTIGVVEILGHDLLASRVQAATEDELSDSVVVVSVRAGGLGDLARRIEAL